jgi:plastocyanin
MSHDEHGHEKEPIILTSGRRMGKGLTIVVITLAIGAGITIPFFDEFFANPPPVTQIRVQPPPGEPPQTGGPTIIQIPSGASAQGNPSYEPANANVPIEGPGSEIVWDNLDSVPHTATSGTGPDDPESGALFDTSIINANDKSGNIVLEGGSEGDVIDYYCILHPYMIGQLTIVQAGGGAQAGEPEAGRTSSGAAAGATINILEGSSVQGNPDYDPEELTAKVGDEITVVNQDNVPHTVTSGTGSNDPNKGQAFDTNIIIGGESAKISLAEVDPGTYDYFCIVHPYMTGKITVE